MITSNPDDESIKTKALEWINSNLNHPQVCQLLVPLITSNPDDESIKAKALEWINSNFNHPQTCELLRALIVKCHNDPKVEDLACRWIDGNPSHFHFSAILSAIVRHFEDKQTWLQLSIKYLEKIDSKNKVEIINAILFASKGESSILDAALEFIENTPNKGWIKSVRLHITKTAIRNPSAVFKYLATDRKEQRKNTLCDCCALRLKKMILNLRDFILKWDWRIPSKEQSRLLESLIFYNLNSPDLDDFLIDWLRWYYRKSGYDLVLEELYQHKNLCSRLIERGLLPVEIENEISR